MTLEMVLVHRRYISLLVISIYMLVDLNKIKKSVTKVLSSFLDP